MYSIYDKECARDILDEVQRQFPHCEVKKTVEGFVTGAVRAFVVRGADVSLEQLNSLVEKVSQDIKYPCSRFHPGDAWPDVSWL